jgi:ribosomal protein S18 acetylase RimI-like enzyme
MNIRIREDTADVLPAYGEIPIAFEVGTAYRVHPVGGGSGRYMLTEEAVQVPYVKDYDSNPGEEPEAWPKRWDLSRWRIVSAFAGRRRIAGAAVVLDATGMRIAGNRDDAGILWDIRVHPEFRRQGIGAKLVMKAFELAAACRRSVLLAETQNVNVPACRFYAAQGYELEAVHRRAYARYPAEVQLIWQRLLG